MRALAAAAAAALILAPSASARTDSIRSFDGTKIVLNFFPAEELAEGGKAPTVLFGPGWSQAGQDNQDAPSEPTVGSIGPGPLRKAGYNVLTWDPRGFGDSEGTAQADSAEYEGRDVQALLDYVARQDEAQLDGAGDPRVGMTGASYGGSIQLVVAGIDKRVDAIVPDIAWNSILRALYRDDTFKAGWGTILFGAGQQGNLDPHIYDAYNEGVATGKISKENEEWFAARDTAPLVERIRIPTLLTQGTVDTLFGLDQAADNYEILRRNGVPVQMLWFCGGHGACYTDPGDTTKIEKRAIAWLDRWLKRKAEVETGPRFEWLDQDGKAFQAAEFPPVRVGDLTAAGKGTLPLTNSGGSGPGAGGTGLIPALSGPTNGTRAANAVDVTFATPQDEVPVLGAPEVTLTYTGSGGAAETRVYAQIVDDATNVVLGNLTTPVPILLDGKEHTVKRPLEMVAATARPGSTFTLQVTASSSNYDPQRTSGTVDFKSITAKLPVVDPRRTVARDAAPIKIGRPRIRGRRASVPLRLRGGVPVSNVVVKVIGRGGRTAGTRRIGRLGKSRNVVFRLRRGARGPFGVRVTARRADGSAIRASRKRR